MIDLAQAQKGFTRADGTLINNVILQTVIKKRRKAGKPLVAMSSDLAKAFDRVNLTSIVDALRRQGIDEQTIQYIKGN